jgi:hypothetical protein
MPVSLGELLPFKLKLYHCRHAKELEAEASRRFFLFRAAPKITLPREKGCASHALKA